MDVYANLRIIASYDAQRKAKTLDTLIPAILVLFSVCIYPSEKFCVDSGAFCEVAVCKRCAKLAFGAFSTASTSAVKRARFLARRFQRHGWVAKSRVHKSSGLSPVRLAIRASILGPIVSPS